MTKLRSKCQTVSDSGEKETKKQSAYSLMLPAATKTLPHISFSSSFFLIILSLYDKTVNEIRSSGFNMRKSTKKKVELLPLGPLMSPQLRKQVTIPSPNSRIQAPLPLSPNLSPTRPPLPYCCCLGSATCPPGTGRTKKR